jgi:hypothetical protein
MLQSSGNCSEKIHPLWSPGAATAPPSRQTVETSAPLFLPSLEPLLHPSVAAATAAHVRAVASPAIIRAAARRHTGAAPHDHAASSAPHDRVALMKGSTPHHLGHRRSTRPEPHRLARSRLAPRRPALAASPTVSRCRSSQITAARRRPLPLWTG